MTPLAKFLQTFKHTIQKIIERVGHYIQTASISTLVTQGIEREQGYLETLLSINTSQEFYQNQIQAFFKSQKPQLVKSTELFLQYENNRKMATKTLLESLESRVRRYIDEQFSSQLRS